ncbi:hypothetical protein CPB84DRAFT_1704432 [Gymnopilus junonius]|uniref:F-box domain-containing protein n=1 Tax=Gymnopilus junonius TaxID=109634 RepID=A0A9P5TRM9_GYMJU|nr:hypothetical protein CPB84DRAFT_1704432 [Gymnopilus junonius]
MSQLCHPNIELAFCSKCSIFIRPSSHDTGCGSSKHFRPLNDYKGFIFETDCDLTEMDLEIQRMDHHIEKLQIQRALACRERNRHAPIARLPIEIISEVFLWGFFNTYVGGYDTKPTTFPLLLGKVCHRWRHIAWGLTALWSYLHCCISKRRCSSQADLLKDWLARSQLRLLSIRITMEDEDAWTSATNTSTEIMDVLARHCSRWHRLSLVLPEHWYEKLSQVRGQVHNLISLSIRPPGRIFVLKTLDVFSDAPNLRTLHSSHYYLHDLHCPWTQLTTAALGTASVDEALELIRRCPNLTTCQFEDLNAMEGNFTADVVTNSQIQFLEISLDPSVMFNEIFAYLLLPNLCNLGLTLPETHGTPIPAIEAFIERSASPLKVVHINGPFINEQDIVTFLIYNQSVTDIKVQSPTNFNTQATD